MLEMGPKCLHKSFAILNFKNAYELFKQGQFIHPEK